MGDFMAVYVAEIGGKAVLAFGAENEFAAKQFVEGEWLSGASGKLNAIPWAVDSLLHATLPCDHCLSECWTHLADAPLRSQFAAFQGPCGSELRSKTLRNRERSSR